jgi:hypothetical protein
MRSKCLCSCFINTIFYFLDILQKLGQWVRPKKSIIANSIIAVTVHDLLEQKLGSESINVNITCRYSKFWWVVKIQQVVESEIDKPQHNTIKLHKC